MHYFNNIAAFRHGLVLALSLSTPWTVWGESARAQVRLPHLSAQQSAEFEAGKQAASVSTGDFQSPESRAAKASLEKLDDESLLAFSVRLQKLNVLNPESLDKVLSEVPSASSSASVRSALQALVQVDPQAKATLTGFAKDILLSRLEGGSEGSSLSQRLAELERREKEKSEDLLRELEEKIALENLLGGGTGAGSSGSAGSPSAGAGSPAAQTPAAKSKEEPYSKDDKHSEKKSADNRLNEILKSLDSNKAAAPSDEKKEPNAQASVKKKKAAEPSSDAPKSEPANSPLPPETSELGQSLPKPALTGNFIGLSPIPSPSSSPGGTAAEPPAQAGSFGPVQGSVGSGIAAASAGQGFPFFASDSPGAPPAPQKYEYARDNPYGNSNGEGASTPGGTEDFSEVDATERVSGNSELHFDKTRRLPSRLISGQDQPAFARALSLAISGLCVKGSLDCDRSEKGARQ